MPTDRTSGPAASGTNGQPTTAPGQGVTAPDYNQIKAKFDKNLKPEQFVSDIDSSQSIIPNIFHCVGKTPLVRLERFVRSLGLENGGEILGKCEFLNAAAGSVKDRLALGMTGIDIRQDMSQNSDGSPAIVEASSGNTGLALASLAAVQGRRCVITIGHSVTVEKEYLLRALGATVLRAKRACPWYDSHDAKDPKAAQAAARMRDCGFDVDHLDQYTHSGNKTVHYLTTAEEILAQARDRPIDYIVIGSGTGGTLAGLARKFKEVSPTTKIIGVEPEGAIAHYMCDDRYRGIVCTRKEYSDNADRPKLPMEPQPGQDAYELASLQTRTWHAEGIGKPFFPSQLNPDDIDSFVSIPDKESVEMAKAVIKSEGLLVGVSAGTALAGAVRILKSAGKTQKNLRIVVVLPDSARNYLTHFLDDGWSLIYEYMTLKAYRAEHGTNTTLFGGTSLLDDPFYARTIGSVLDDIKIENVKKIEVSALITDLLASYTNRPSKEVKNLVFKVLEDSPADKDRTNDDLPKIIGVMSWTDLQEAVADKLTEDVSDSGWIDRPILGQLTRDSESPLTVGDILHTEFSKILSPENSIGDLLRLTGELQRVGKLRDPAVIIHMGLAGTAVEGEVCSCKTFKKPKPKQGGVTPVTQGSKFVIVLRSRLLKIALSKWIPAKGSKPE